VQSQRSLISIDIKQSATMCAASTFGTDRSRRIDAALRQLLESSLGFTAEEEPDNFQIALKFALHNIHDKNHRFLDSDARQVRRSFHDIIERMTIFNQDAQAKTLSRLLAAYERSLPPLDELEVPDAPYRILSLLACLAQHSKSSDDLTSPVRLLTTQRRYDDFIAESKARLQQKLDEAAAAADHGMDRGSSEELEEKWKKYMGESDEDDDEWEAEMGTESDDATPASDDMSDDEREEGDEDEDEDDAARVNAKVRKGRDARSHAVIFPPPRSARKQHQARVHMHTSLLPMQSTTGMDGQDDDDALLNMNSGGGMQIFNAGMIGSGGGASAFAAAILDPFASADDIDDAPFDYNAYIESDAPRAQSSTTIVDKPSMVAPPTLRPVKPSIHHDPPLHESSDEGGAMPLRIEDVTNAAAGDAESESLPPQPSSVITHMHASKPWNELSAMLHERAIAAAIASGDTALLPLLAPRPLCTELHLIQQCLYAWHGHHTPFFPSYSTTGLVSFVACASVQHLSDETVASIMKPWSDMCNARRRIEWFISKHGDQSIQIRTGAKRALTSRPGRCISSFCACLLSILNRIDAMLLPLDEELRRQLHSMAMGRAHNSNSDPVALNRNIPLTLLSFNQFAQPYLQQLKLVDEIIRKADHRLVKEMQKAEEEDEKERHHGFTTTEKNQRRDAIILRSGIKRHGSATAPLPFTACSLLSLLHSTMQFHSLLCSPAAASILFCLFLAAFLPYLDYLDTWTSRGVLPTTDDVNDGEFMIVRMREDGVDGHEEGRRNEENVDIDASVFRTPLSRSAPTYSLRTGPDGSLLVPSFLLPYAEQILRTGSSLAMVQTMRRVHGVNKDQERNANAMRAQRTAKMSLHLYARPASSSTLTASTSTNLFESFHLTLIELFAIGRPQTSQRDKSNTSDVRGDTYTQAMLPSDNPYDDDSDEEKDEKYNLSSDSSLDSPNAPSADASPRLHSVHSSARALRVDPSSPSDVSQDDAAPGVTDVDRDSRLAIFFQTSWNTVHPIFQPHTQHKTIPHKRDTKSRSNANLSDNAPPPPASSLTSIPSSEQASFLSPALHHPSLSTRSSHSHSHTQQPVFAPPLVRFEPEILDETDDKETGSLPKNVGTKPSKRAHCTSSSFDLLSSLPVSTSLSALHSLLDLLLFHVDFPTSILPDVIGCCVVRPLAQRHLDATKAFVHTIMQQCGLGEHLSALRDLFFMADGFLSYDVCRTLFDKLDHWEVDILGLNDCLAESVSSHASPRVRRLLGPSLTLLLVSSSASASNVAVSTSSSSSGESDADRDPAFLQHPHSIHCMDQLQLQVHLPWPLNQIITPDAIIGYNKIWRFLLQLRRAELALDECAFGGNGNGSGNNGGRGYRAFPGTFTPSVFVSTRSHPRCVHIFYQLKCELSHFMRHMLDYVLSRCVHGAWEALATQLQRTATSSDMEEMRKAHQQYLDTISMHILMTPKLSAALGSIKRILGLCMDLRLLYNTVLVDLMYGAEGDFVFDPPDDGHGTLNAGDGEDDDDHEWDEAQLWARKRQAAHSRRTSVDMDMAEDAEDESSNAPFIRHHQRGHTRISSTASMTTTSASSTTAAAAAPRRIIRLSGISSYSSFRARLVRTATEQLRLIKNDFRHNIRFLVIVLSKMAENGINQHLQDVLTRLTFNDFYKVDL